MNAVFIYTVEQLIYVGCIKSANVHGLYFSLRARLDCVDPEGIHYYLTINRKKEEG